MIFNDKKLKFNIAKKVNVKIDWWLSYTHKWVFFNLKQYNYAIFSKKYTF